ncbi:MAG TPA: hypothetical protein VJN65_09105 [Bacteroidota bacterium]|nr:hypothetical protein [Bacteroidota bacterium]
MAYIWFVVGAVVVSAVFFLTGKSLDPWPGLDAATIVAAVYLLALSVYTTRKPFPLKSRIVVLLFCVGFVVAAGSFSMKFRETTAWQKSQLLKILGVIQKGMLNSQLPDHLLATLEKYHRQPAKKKTIGQVFKEVVPGATIGKNIYRQEGGESDTLKIFIAGIADDEVVLIGQGTWGKGRSPEFKNYDGKSGMVQERAVLTVKGVTYESQN